MSMAVVWVFDFPFLSKVAPENSCRWASLSPLAWHCRLSSQGASSSSPPSSFFPFRAERAQCCKSGRDVSLFSGCLSTTRPLSSALSWPVCQQCKQPSIPRARRGGASVKEWSDRVKYREIQQRESAQSLRNFGPFESESPQVLFLFFVTVHLVASWLLWSDLDERLF